MTEPQPSKPNELEPSPLHQCHDGKGRPMFKSQDNGTLAWSYWFCRVCDDSTTSSDKTTYSHTDVEGNYEEIDEAVNEILYHKVLKPARDIPDPHELPDSPAPDVQIPSDTSDETKIKDGLLTYTEMFVRGLHTAESLQQYVDSIQRLLQQARIDELERFTEHFQIPAEAANYAHETIGRYVADRLRKLYGDK